MRGVGGPAHRLGATTCLLVLLLAACSESSRGTATTPTDGTPASPSIAESPASFEIAFTSKRNGSWSIFTVNEEGQQTKISDITTVEKGPTRLWLDLLGQTDWSPDGSSFLFTCTWPGRSEICLSRPGGSTQLLTSDEGDADVHPTWAPDGERIFYAEYEPGPLDYEIYSIRPDGSDKQLVFGGPGKQADPSVSPDGRMLAFTTFTGTGPTISLAALNDSDVGQVFNKIDDASTMDWSPDGTQIVFSRTRDKRFLDLYLADARGGNPRRLTESPGLDFWPTWSPDGTMIAFARETGFNGEKYQESDVYVIEVDSAAIRNVTDDPGPNMQPDWRP